MSDAETLNPPMPRTNPDLLGHEGAERCLFDVWQSGRLPHAWLITGPRGVGKATLAYRFARFVLAGGETAATPDAASPLYLAPTHPVFQRTAIGSHGDLLVIENGDEGGGRKRREISVEESRRIGPFLTMTAAEGGWRVVVVDSADEMNRAAGNAMLKLLEEPPARALLLIVSHNPGRVLPTIRSRCRHLALRPLQEEHMMRLLRDQRPDLEAATLEALVQLAGGSLGNALRLAEVGGTELYRELLGLLQTLPELDVPLLHEFAGRVSGPRAGESWPVVTDLLSQWLTGLIKRHALGRDMPEIVGGEAALGRQLQAGANLAEWVEVWEKISRLSAEAERSHLDRKQVLLNVFHTLERAVRQPAAPAG